VFEDLNDTTKVMLLWPATNALIIEEHMSTKAFEHLHCVEPYLIWVKGSSNLPEENSVVDLSKFTSLDNLNVRNLDAISKADDLRSVVVIVDSSHISDVVSVLTVAEKDDDKSIIYSANVDFKAGAAIGNDGDEVITVHTAYTPGDILEDEQRLLDHLGQLNNPKSGIKELPLKVGGHAVVVQTFHYPAINLEAPQNKRQRTYVNRENMPILYSYEAKEVLTIYLHVPLGNGKLGRKVRRLMTIFGF
jgi:hypothetical protein